MHWRITLITFLFCSISLFGVEDKSTWLVHEGKVIGSLTIQGLQKTKETVVTTELLFREGEVLNSEILAESLQRLRNIQIFSKVSMTATPLANDRVEISIECQESWTLIPIVKVGGGGGTT